MSGEVLTVRCIGIWKLKHKVEQQQKLLAKVPEDILNQLNCKERGQER